LFGQGFFDGFMDVRRFYDSLVRGFWRIVAFDGFRTNSFFCDEFYGRAEEVVEESPFFGIKVVESWSGKTGQVHKW